MASGKTNSREKKMKSHDSLSNIERYSTIKRMKFTYDKSLIMLEERYREHLPII